MLFPIAFLWVIVVIVWVIRNEVTPEQEKTRRWTRLPSRPPRRPRRGRPNGSRARASGRSRLPRGTPRNARTALSGVEKSIVGGLHPEAPDEAIRETRLGTALDSPLCDGGGETACYAHLVCPECGAVLDGGAHASGCSGKA